jgi:6-phosphogluconolactonase
MEVDPCVRFEQLEDADGVARTAAEAILLHAERAIAARGVFRIVLSGGTTPLAAYRLLARESADWDAWEVFFGDERCVPSDSEDRNDVAARRAWLDGISIRRDRIFGIPAELGAERAARVYARTIGLKRPFDLVLLGMGEDGHTASLFPGRDVAVDALAVAVHDAPKPPPDRVSLTPKALTDCRAMLILVTGSSKQVALSAWRSGSDLPVARIAAAGHARVLTDCAAAGH